MNTLASQQKTGAVPLMENGAINNERVVILDAGSQYGKVSKISLEN